MKNYHSDEPVQTLLTTELKPLSEAELIEIVEKRKKRRLDSTIVSLIVNDEFAKDICKWIADNDKLYSNIQTFRGEKKRRRPPIWTDAAHIQLLHEYASSLISEGNIDSLECKKHGGLIYSGRSIENQITKAIHKVKSGEITISDWAKAVVQDRIVHGDKLHQNKANKKKGNH